MNFFARGHFHAGNDRQPGPGAGAHNRAGILSRVVVAYPNHIQACLTCLLDDRRCPHLTVAARRKARMHVQVGPYLAHH